MSKQKRWFLWNMRVLQYAVVMGICNTATLRSDWKRDLERRFQTGFWSPLLQSPTPILHAKGFKVRLYGTISIKMEQYIEAHCRMGLFQLKYEWEEIQNCTIHSPDKHFWVPTGCQALFRSPRIQQWQRCRGALLFAQASSLKAPQHNFKTTAYS